MELLWILNLEMMMVMFKVEFFVSSPLSHTEIATTIMDTLDDYDFDIEDLDIMEV